MDHALKVLEELRTGVALTDGEGNVIYANPAFESLSGRTSVLGTRLADLVLAPQRPGVEQRLEQVLDGSVSEARFLAHLEQEENPKEVEFLAHLASDPAAEGGMVVTISDATHQRKSVDELARSLKRESLGLMAGGIAHDFNNLLQSIATSTDILAARFDEDDPDWEFIELLRESGARMAALTGQLRTFARGGNPRPTLLKIPTILEDVLSGSRFQGESRVRVKVVVSRDLHVVHADPSQMYQLFHNVTVNAFEAIEESRGNLSIIGRNVTLARGDPLLREDDLDPGEYIEITFSDDGHGIPAEDLDRIFDPFFSTKSFGSGLGLAAAHGIIRSHQGAMRIESETGRGTRLRIYLPAASS